MAKKMSAHHYKSFEYGIGDNRLPMIAQRDEFTEKERLNRKFALAYLGNENDKDVQWDIMVIS